MTVKICLSGPTACGKTTLARKLVEYYGATFISTSDLLLRYAAMRGLVEPTSNDRHYWISPAAQDFNAYRLLNPDLDRYVDEEIKYTIENLAGPLVVDSRVYPQLRSSGHKVFCLYLTADLDTRALRGSQEGGKIPDLRQKIAGKDQVTAEILRRAWDLDIEGSKYLNLFDFILDDTVLEDGAPSRAVVMNRTFQIAVAAITAHYH